MDVIYATLIIKGAYTFDMVPNCIKERTRKVLLDLDMKELI